MCCPGSQPTKSATQVLLWLKASVLFQSYTFFVCFHDMYTIEIYHIIPWKWWWKTSLSFWEDLFSGAMLVYRRVGISYPSAPAAPFDLLAFALNCEDLQWACDLNKDFVFAGDLTLGSTSVSLKNRQKTGLRSTRQKVCWVEWDSAFDPELLFL